MIHELYTHELLAMKQKDQQMRVDAKVGVSEEAKTTQGIAM